jgi:hypothetical protein
MSGGWLWLRLRQLMVRPWFMTLAVVLVLLLLVTQTPAFRDNASEGRRRASAVSTARAYLGYLVDSPPAEAYAMACPSQRRGRSAGEYYGYVMGQLTNGAVLEEATVSLWNATGAVQLAGDTATVRGSVTASGTQRPVDVELEDAGGEWTVCERRRTYRRRTARPRTRSMTAPITLALYLASGPRHSAPMARPMPAPPSTSVG